MDVFISWSGKRSGAAAEALRDWLPKIINALNPWLSAADIDKGARWGTEIASKLRDSKAGIICLTADNLHSDWLLFEAGALSKTIENTYVCPLLIGLEPADVKPPLAQFQATRATKNDVLKLLRTLNSALGDAALPITHIEEAFEVWWPKLEAKLTLLPSDGTAIGPQRSERDLLEEVLALVRNQSRPAAPSQPEHPAALKPPEYAPACEPRPSWEDPVPKKLHEILPGLVPDVRTVTISRWGGALAFRVEGKNGNEYKLLLPKDIREEDIERVARSQIESTSKPTP